MTTGRAGALGYTPKLTIKPSNPEASKYLQLWNDPRYREYAPGEAAASTFMAQAKPGPKDTVIDFGCGTGRGALMIAILGGGTKVTMLDFADNCLDEEVRQALDTQKHVLSFQIADLEKPIPEGITAKYGFCTDVMEHIPTDKVPTVLKNIMRAAQHVFFQISLVDDAFGATIGQPLHLTVKPRSWWAQRLREAGAMVHWSEEHGGNASFYVSNWTDAKELVRTGTTNTGEEKILVNVRSALARGLPTLRPYDRQTTTVMLLGGGPSLADFEDEIREKRLTGQPLVTTNGSYNWCMDRGIIPSAQVVVDARDFNKRFLAPIAPTCKYMLASQCHPASFDAVPKEQTLLWHAGMNDKLASFLDEWHGARNEPWYPVPGGSTVMLRVFSLLRILGFCNFEVYGFDSCLREDTHHAYEQKENDKETLLSVSCGSRIFKCHPWMASQAHEFMDLVKLLGDEVSMDIKGDGLIAHILETGANLED